MSRILLFSNVIIAFLLLGILPAQPSSGWGIGVSIVDIQQIFEFSTTEGNAYNSSIVVPFIVSPTFRLEPEFGLYRGKNTVELNDNKGEYTSTQWRVGIGIFPQSTLKSSTLYYGARVGYLTFTNEEKETVAGYTETYKVTSSGFFIAPALGGEYFFSNSFCIGAEAQIFYASISTDITDSELDISDSMISTRGLVFVRFYF